MVNSVSFILLYLYPGAWDPGGSGGSDPPWNWGFIE